MTLCRWSRALLGLALLATAPTALAAGVWPSVVLDPNPHQDLAKPMRVSIEGVYGPLRVAVLRDCNGDGLFDTRGTPTCVSPLATRTATAHGGRAELSLDLRTLGIPPDVRRLGLRACVDYAQISSRTTERPRCSSVVFYLGRERCGVLATLQSLRASTECSPRWADIIDLLRAKPDAVPRRFDVRLARPDRDRPKATPLLDTLDATGVAWDGDSLLITRAPRGTTLSSLTRITLAGTATTATTLWTGAAGEAPIAPIKLRSGAIAFVVERPSSSTYALVLLESGRTTRTPIAIPVRRILADDGQILIGETTVHDVRELVAIERRTGEVTHFGSDFGSYLSLLRSPAADLSPYDYLDASGQYGWEVDLVSSSTRTLTLAEELGDQMLAVFSPDGARVAFLAEVGAKDTSLR